jgi:predicted porin
MRFFSGFIFLLMASTMSSALAASHQNAIKQLKTIVQQQEIALAKQSEEIKQQQQMLRHLSKKLNHLARKRTQKPRGASSSLVSTRTLRYANDSVLTQAISPEDVTTIPRHQLILGSKKAHTSLSGQISVVGFQADDGKFNRTYIGTNSISNSRFNINSELLFSPALTLGSRIQLGLKTNPSESISQTQPNSSSIQIRRAEAYLKTKRWGTLTFGQGETASDNTAYADLSDTEIAGRASVEDIGGGLYFNGVSSNPQVRDAFNGLDGFSRKVRLRYDSPKFHGALVSASLIAGSHSDIALKWGKQLGKTKVAVELAYTSPKNISSGSNRARGNETNGSLSIVLPAGLSLTSAAGQVRANSAGRKNPYYYYIKPGYEFHYFKMGLTALSLDYGQYYNFNQNKDKGTTHGAQVVQDFNPLDLAVYMGYREFALSSPGRRFSDIHLFLMGAMYQF